MNGDTILKKERVIYTKSTFVQWVGDLVLTPSQLSFIRPKGLLTKDAEVMLIIPVEMMLNIRAKKAFLPGSDHLEVLYKDGNKERKVLFVRNSVASSSLLGGASRLEANSLASWEKAINDIRMSNLNPVGSSVGKTPVDILKERLAQGEISLEEFKSLREALEN